MAILITKGTTPNAGEGGFSSEGVKFIKSESLNYECIIDDTKFVFISEETNQKLKRSILKENDILFSIAGIYLGKTGVIKKHHLPANTNQACAIIRLNHEVVNHKFISQYFTDKSFINHVNSLTAQSAQPNINLKDIGNLKFRLPPLPTQQKIAHILGTYDELIEVNNERIKLLEETAQSLYKEWFVRFRFPNYQETEFIKGVPKGWEIGKLESLCNQITDGTHDSPKQKKEGFPLITGKHIKNGFIDFHDAYFISEEDHDKISKRSGLLQGDIIFSNIGTIGNTTIIKYDEKFSVKNVLIFRPLMLEYSSFLYYYLTNESNLEQLLADSFGTSQQFLSLGYCRKLKCLIPTSNIIQEFNDLVNPMIEQKYALQQQNTELRQIRGRLLPRLISGKMLV